MLSNLLLYRFVIFNTLMFALVAALAWNGTLAPIYHNDQSGLTIDIYIDDDSRVEPRPLLLPWDNETANAIQRALDGAPDGSEGEFMMSYEPSIDMTEQQFHSVPPEPSLPPKDTPQPGLNYEHG